MGKHPRGQQGTGRRPRSTNGGAHSHRNSGKHRNAARGAETSRGGWRVQGTSRWETLRTRIEGGERVKIRQDTGDEWLWMAGAVGKRRQNKNSEKWQKQMGQER